MNCEVWFQALVLLSFGRPSSGWGGRNHRLMDWSRRGDPKEIALRPTIEVGRVWACSPRSVVPCSSGVGRDMGGPIFETRRVT